MYLRDRLVFVENRKRYCETVDGYYGKLFITELGF